MNTVFNIFQKRPAHLGNHNGQLTPCPSTPNCVSSQNPRGVNYISPIYYQGSLEEAKAHLKKTILSMMGAKITHESANYIYAEYRTLVMRFIDDVECLIDDHTKTIHVRSASRFGYGDMDTNRKRIERIRRRFHDSH